MLNPSGASSIPISLFGGVNQEIDPADLPLGLSPDCCDVAVLPGQVFTRPPLRRYSTLGTTAQIVYTHSFPKRDGTIVKMDFDSLGGIWANGVKVGSTAAGSRFFATNADGRTFIAISDGSKGIDVPLQFDGTNLDRVSQDGPAAPPVVANYSIPQSTLVAGSVGASVAIATAQPSNPQQTQVGGGYQYQNNYQPGNQQSSYSPPQYQTYYTSLVITTSAAHGLSVGQQVSISGNSQYNYSGVYVSAVDSPTVFEIAFYGQSNAAGTGGQATLQAPLLSRIGNTVQAATGAPHKLRAGYEVQIASVADEVIAVSSIAASPMAANEAIITTSSANGLVVGNEVYLNSVASYTLNIASGETYSSPTGVGVRNQVVTQANHNLSVGMTVIIQNFGDSPHSGDGTYAVYSVDSPTTFSVLNNASTAGSTSGAQGTVTVPFPIVAGMGITVGDVLSPTTFQIAFPFSSGTWTGGNLTFPWNGSFFVISTPTAQTFTYRQVGPDAIVQSGTGTVTPLGQVAPGNRGVACVFQTRNGYLTAPSPTLQWVSNGDGYAFVTGIPIGPSNVTARIIIFTLANGARYFYLPLAPRDPTTASVIGTSTVINDNTTTSAIFDFSDEALEAGIAVGPVDVPGNNLFQQAVLGACLGFYAYEGRLCAWGEVNKVQNFLNMGFEGGVSSSAPNIPLGWTVTGSGTLTSGDYGLAWTPTGSATISQSAYQDSVGAPILQGNTQYTLRAWVNGTATATISSASAGFNTTATLTASEAQVQANFSAKTPLVIPSDLVISYGGAAIDEIQIIYTANPVNLGLRASYEENPEAFDLITGTFGPSDDPNAVTGVVSLNGVLSLLTNGPKGNHYRVEDSTSGEPASWTIRRQGEKCGVISPWAIATFETWFCWGSDTGVRMFYGADVEKMSQEVQRFWDSINPKAKQFTVFANDPYERRLHILAATGTAMVANTWWVMDYRELNTSQSVASSGTLRVVSSGKVVTTDLTRKWAPWTPTLNYCAVLQANDGSARMVFCGGTGGSLADSAYSATYSLAEGDLTGIDDDFGPFWDTSYYTTAFFPEVELASQYQLKPYRMLFTYLTENVRGNGSVVNTTLLGGLGVVGDALRPVSVSLNLATDRGFGLNSAAERMAIRISCQPAGPQPAPANAPAGFAVSAMVISAMQHPFSPIAGWNK